jgi:hypothetical protein
VKRMQLFAAVLLTACASCVSHAPPAAGIVAEQVVPNPDGTVHAFRVDIVKMDRPAPQARYTLTPIPVDKRGVIASQEKRSSPEGYLVPQGTTITITAAREETTKMSVLVRLYRPGYRTIEVKPGENPRDLQWVVARDVAAEEKAIDDLLADPNAPYHPNWISLRDEKRITWWEQKDLKASPLGLEPGGTSNAHRDVLKFASSEYTRLSMSFALAIGPTGTKIQERLHAKALTINAYAERMPTKVP